MSTGRCGSTMLSELLALHPAVLSISEFFNALAPFAFNKRSANGATFWQVLSAPRRRHTVWLELMRDGLVIDEFRYPGKAAGRFVKTGIPPLLAMTLPPLTDDPDGLHEELRAFVEALGPALEREREREERTRRPGASQHKARVPSPSLR